MLAAWLGAVGSAVVGGIGTLVVVGLWMMMFPTLRRRQRLHMEPVPGEASSQTI
jgi:ACR3 family arsenite efflux pump ArsB